MTAFASARTQMRSRAATQIQGNGVAVQINRFTPTTDPTGRKTGSYVSTGASEMMWIQPFSGGADVVEEGIQAETTHLIYQAWSGTALQASDRLAVSGDPYVYDVVRADVFETHRRAQAKQVRRM